LKLPMQVRKILHQFIEKMDIHAVVYKFYSRVLKSVRQSQYPLAG
jgi:hypothetical protein